MRRRLGPRAAAVLLALMLTAGAAAAQIQSSPAGIPDAQTPPAASSSTAAASSDASQSTASASGQQQAGTAKPAEPNWHQAVDTDTMAAYAPGKGINLYRSEVASLNLSAYALVRWVDQLPARQTFLDHLGNLQTTDPRNDIQFHRVMVYFLGFVYNPRFTYSVILWSVNSTGQVAVIGTLGYSFGEHLSILGGVNGLPGTRTLQGSHPYWLGSDRVMADDFFRPGFTAGVWATGQIVWRSYYTVMVGNNLSQLGINAVKLTRDLTGSASIWLLPTTGEFGPRGGLGDFEWHEDLATRVGVSYTYSRENRFNQIAVNQGPDNTQIRLTDSLLFFATGSLAPGVTVRSANYYLFAADAGMKTHGFFLQSEAYSRLLDRFDTDGPVPMATIRDTGFYVQTSQMIVPKLFEVYGSTSWIYGDKRWNFPTSHEYIGGLNYYPARTRNLRMNFQVIRMFGSSMGGVFGYYTGGQSGTTLSIGTNLLF